MLNFVFVILIFIPIYPLFHLCISFSISLYLIIFLSFPLSLSFSIPHPSLTLFLSFRLPVYLDCLDHVAAEAADVMYFMMTR